MQSRTKGDNRRSGRTTRMLAAALAKVYNGGTAVVVVPRGAFDYCVPILRDLGATYIHKWQRYAEFGKGSKIEIRVIGDPTVKSEYFEVEGFRPEYVFWDHEAVRQAHNQVIQRYHEYD